VGDNSVYHDSGRGVWNSVLLSSQSNSAVHISDRVLINALDVIFG
jgi:hypothetical protein